MDLYFYTIYKLCISLLTFVLIFPWHFCGEEMIESKLFGANPN